MSKPWEADYNFVMYLNSGNRGTHPLEPGVTTVRSAFRQELEIPLSLSPDWQVALFSMYYTHSFSNAVLKSPTDWHCQVGCQHAGLPPVVQRSIQLSRHQQFTHFEQVLYEKVGSSNLKPILFFVNCRRTVSLPFTTLFYVCAFFYLFYGRRVSSRKACMCSKPTRKKGCFGKNYMFD